LETILATELKFDPIPGLLVGNDSLDDAAVFDLGDGRAVISTTDFFMPIVDDAFDFGRIAACNAISDVYAMGGVPLMAIAILGWPANTLPAELAAKVVDGGRSVCAEAGIPLAGGHSIDAPEPMFGLAVTGIVDIARLKTNAAAQVGDRLYLTKPLGVGILTTAQKQKKITPEHMLIANDSMCSLNTIGGTISAVEGVSAITDITGFGLLGHLLEVCDGSGVAAELDFAKVPVIPEVEAYRAMGCVPGGTNRNFDSYGEKVSSMSEAAKQILCDPQTSGGLLVCVSEAAEEEFKAVCTINGLSLTSFGTMTPKSDAPTITVSE
jgi:selenide,water dikinase